VLANLFPIFNSYFRLLLSKITFLKKTFTILHVEFEVKRKVSQMGISRSVIVKRLGRVILLALFIILCTIPITISAQQKKLGLYDDLFSVSFPTEKDGWACGRWGTVLHTSDGGKTWIRQDSGTDYTLSSIFFVDSHNGWAVGDQGTVIHTADGGKTWQKQKSPVPFFLMRVYFATPLKGWIVGEWTHILNTDDGGKTWRIQFKDEDYILKSVSFCDAVHGWAVGEYGYIYHTRDGGGSWKKQSGYFRLEKETGRPEGGSFLFDVVAVNPQTAWVVGIDGYVSKTVDGGETWQKVPTGAPKTQLFCVVSDKTNSILIGGKGVFLSSADGGKTWQSPSFEPPISYGWLYGLTQRQDSYFVAVGWEGAIYLSSSTSWHRVIY
jgi:photosystem II stability/assembly factor-like uncharacterized protein